MGIYVNPGNEEFKRAANSKIYVDKTMLLAFTNQNLKSEHQNICVSRPRRFGKSMAANMLSAYYGAENDSHALFKPYRISKDSSFEEHINKYNVIQINMIDFMTRTSSAEEMIDYLQRRILWNLKKAYGQLECFDWNDLVNIVWLVRLKGIARDTTPASPAFPPQSTPVLRLLFFQVSHEIQDKKTEW